MNVILGPKIHKIIIISENIILDYLFLFFVSHRTFVESLHPIIINKSTIRLHTVIFTLYSLHIVRACARPSFQIFLLASMLPLMLCSTASMYVLPMNRP